MQRRISGFRLDDDNHWVAVLDCHHGHHVRHDPPWQLRPWTQTDEGRASMIGEVLECPKCEWIEVPEGLTHDRTTAEWDEESVPRAIRRDHRVASGVWGRVRVLEGSIRFQFADGLGGEVGDDGLLNTTQVQPIPPGRPHHLEVVGPVRVVVDFLVMPPDGTDLGQPSRPATVDREES